MKKIINGFLAVLIIGVSCSLSSFKSAESQTVISTQSAANAISVASSITSLTNSTTNTTLFSKTIPGGLLGSSRGIHLTFLAQLSSTLVNPTMTITFKYGTATIAALSGVSINASLSTVPFFIECDIMNNNSTGSQVAITRVFQSTISAPVALSSSVFMNTGSWTIDSTTDQTLAVTAQFNSALTGTSLIPVLLTMKIE